MPAGSDLPSSNLYNVHVGTPVEVCVRADCTAASASGFSDVRKACTELDLDVTVTRLRSSHHMYTRAQQRNMLEATDNPTLEHVEKVLPTHTKSINQCALLKIP